MPIENLNELPGFSSWLSVVKCYQKCQKIMNTRLADLGMNVAQHDVLLTIQNNQNHSQQALSKELLVAKSNVSSLIKKLESKKLIKRTIDEFDGRKKLLNLTEKGQKLLVQSLQIQKDVFLIMRSAMTEQDLILTETIMNKVRYKLMALDKK